MSQTRIEKLKNQSSKLTLSIVRVHLKIVWAVDPFIEEKSILRSAARCLRALIQSNITSPSAWIEPVYIWANAPDGPFIQRQDFEGIIQRDSEEALREILMKLKISGIQPIRVLSKPELSVRESARELIAYAKSIGAELIVVSSHGRKGMNRMVLGSFAETLSLYSEVPLLIVHPQLNNMPSFKTVLFPTDFSDESKNAFEKIIDFAINHKSKIILFHKMPSLDAFGPFFSNKNYDYFENATSSIFAACEQVAKVWEESALKRGLQLEVVFDRSRRGRSASDAILKQAKKLNGIIAMASHSGPVASVFLGSTTRQVIRNSEKPVWIIHPQLRKSA